MNTFSYSVSKVIDAPASTIWRAWTTPEGQAGIFRADPATSTTDPRPGGCFGVTMTLPDHTEIPMTGSYLEVVERRRLVSVMDTPDGPSTPMAMDLAEVDGGTRLTFSQSCRTREECERSEQGSTILLEWVSNYVAKA